MKQFFIVVFGGMIAIGMGIGIAYVGSLGWKALRPMTSSLNFRALAASAMSPTDGTAISGIKRSIRYTANEEEDLISFASLSLPSGADGKVTADSYIVKDLDTGSVAATYNPDRVVPIASLTKLVTAEIARKYIPATDKIQITNSIMSTYGNTAEFRVGETLSASDLMYPLLMVSSNDAAEAFAQHYGRAKFIKAMNEFAQSIGAYRTYFDDPSGLSADNVSSATDLAIILDWIRKNDPTILQITQLESKTVRSHTWQNPTHFLSWSNYMGGKNGYTDEADRTAAALFSLGNPKNTYAVIVLGSETRDPDMIRLLAKVK